MTKIFNFLHKTFKGTNNFFRSLFEKCFANLVLITKIYVIIMPKNVLSYTELILMSTSTFNYFKIVL